jgi:hypothetical protein
MKVTAIASDRYYPGARMKLIQGFLLNRVKSNRSNASVAFGYQSTIFVDTNAAFTGLILPNYAKMRA